MEIRPSGNSQGLIAKGRTMRQLHHTEPGTGNPLGLNRLHSAKGRHSP